MFSLGNYFIWSKRQSLSLWTWWQWLYCLHLPGALFVCTCSFCSCYRRLRRTTLLKFWQSNFALQSAVPVYLSSRIKVVHVHHALSFCSCYIQSTFLCHSLMLDVFNFLVRRIHHLGQPICLCNTLETYEFGNIIATALLEKRVLKGFFIVPYMEPWLLNPQKGFQKIQEPFGDH